MKVDRILALAAVTLAGLACVFAVLGRQAAVSAPVVDSAAPSWDTRLRALEAERAALEARVRRLEQGAASVSARPASAPAQPSAPDAPVRSGGEPTSVAVEAPAGLRVDVNGSEVSVTNSNPALTGQVLTVPALWPDGGRRPLTIVVPPVPGSE